MSDKSTSVQVNVRLNTVKDRDILIRLDRCENFGEQSRLIREALRFFIQHESMNTPQSRQIVPRFQATSTPVTLPPPQTPLPVQVPSTPKPVQAPTYQDLEDDDFLTFSKEGRGVHKK